MNGPSRLIALVTVVALYAFALDDARAQTSTFSIGGTQTIPAGTHVKFHLTETVSSNQSKTGQPFHFVLLDPILVDGSELLPAGTEGSGTVYLAGKAGTGGHEGDLRCVWTPCTRPTAAPRRSATSALRSTVRTRRPCRAFWVSSRMSGYWRGSCVGRMSPSISRRRLKP